MQNNDVIRSLRYTFDFGDDQMIKIFSLAELEVTRAEVSDWLKRDDDPEAKPISDFKLAVFLNGLINYKRGKKEGSQPVPESRLTNNQIIRKIKIALQLQTEDIIEILALAGRDMSKHEISAFFRKPDQHQYRLCRDQVLRNFLQGLQKKFRAS
ncbi:YehS family protein [Cyclobacterium marinum]|uniref:DUF1456 family protein n=1 Tax=Cyclobacterium marinum (strain ATCC 25205 / DSM 745 / LMG 13164 / NCIMB 1802) TaxID=880070 RepID=G0J7U9_CYCMS|nr:DUF1456 family protein [Cyclobacterium marinum]AEL27797.1 protein of unknown function DUF1456 [Cyclobacterium marinum DSM 745]MBI0397578.1 DUF1456 family protein [Cyclobacterium marinum]MBR9777414.1 DUF1456 family protein [Cytophagales bacterium]|tara:strand:+ start:52400 stop:52861 length:462 start_codon:yes stop_codon:yes gene_type:complete